jgi:CheY-like chemotaxis protein
VVKQIEDATPLEGDLNTTVIEDPMILGALMLKDELILLLDAIKLFETSLPQLTVGKKTLAPKTHKPKILYVDDSSFYLKVVSRYLNDAGYEVDVAIDGEKGLEKIKYDQYDILLIDFEMPKMNGLELINHVRKLPEYDLVPVIVLTALTGGKDKSLLINSGIQSYLVKLNKEELLKEVVKLLEMEAVEV